LSDIVDEGLVYCTVIRPQTKQQCGRHLPCKIHPSAEHLRAEIDSFTQIKSDGVDFDKLAGLLRDNSLLVPGWEAPHILPPLWIEEPGTIRGEDGTAMYISRQMRLKVILSCTREDDGNAWMHLSISKTNQAKGELKLPSWSEISEAKRVFLGDREAYQVLPPRARYVNINERVLHLFALYDENKVALPDFTHGTGSL